MTGMVLQSSTIGEFDKRVVLLTKERGRISAFAKGARRPKSHLCAGTEPFAFGEFYIYKGRDSYTIEQLEIKEYFPELRKDLDDLYLALYFCEVADYFTREGMRAKDELNLLYMSFRVLTLHTIGRDLIRRIFELKMIAIEGEAPRLFSCAICEKKEMLHSFYLKEAAVLCDECAKNKKSGLVLSDTAMYTMQRIIASKLDSLYSFTVSDSVMKELDEAIGKYFLLRVDKKFKCL